MNRIYRTVWNDARQCMVVAIETTRSRSKTSTRKIIVEAVAWAILALGAGQAMATNYTGADPAPLALGTGDMLTINNVQTMNHASVPVAVGNGTAAGSITENASGSIVGGVIGNTTLGAGTFNGGITNAGQCIFPALCSD